jgi:CheY-like chemotaxis protein
MVLLDLKLPKVDGMEVLRPLKASTDQYHSGGDPHFVEGRARFDQGLWIGGKQLYPEAGGLPAVPGHGEERGIVLAGTERGKVCGALLAKPVAGYTLKPAAFAHWAAQQARRRY